MPVRSDSEQPCVRLSGRLKPADGVELKNRVLEHLASGAKEVMLDLGEARSVDTSTLGHIMGAHMNCKRHGAALRVVKASDEVRTIFAVTHLNKIIPLD